MEVDPGERQYLHADSRYASVVTDHLSRFSDPEESFEIEPTD
jgi:hypothetical protein